MGVDEHVVVEAVDGVVQRGVVQADLDLVGQRLVGGQDGGDASGDGAADAGLGVAGRQLSTLRVAEQEPYPGAGGGAGAQQRDPVGVAFDEEQAGEGQQVDVAFGVA